MDINKTLIIGSVGLGDSADTVTSKFYTLASVYGLGGDDVFQTPEKGGLITASRFYGGAGDDRLVVNEDTSLLFKSTYDGGSGTDTLEFTSAGRIVMSSDGDAGAPTVTLKTATGSLVSESVERYIIKGSDAGDVLVGGAGNDWLDGRGGLDEFRGSAGNDGYVFDTVGERVVGEQAGGGNDTIWASISVNLNDNANVENLRLTGTASIDGIGNELKNLITGNAGDNVIAGGLGNDQLWGKGGVDTFAFAEMGAANRDSIFDFGTDDFIQLARSAFGGLDAASGQSYLDASDFVIGTKATADHAQVIYNKATGYLSYDADGTGSAVAQDIAFIGKNVALTNDHILLA
ncbi:calcium-binding protein [Aureimonas flava]|uniref:Calcium-binding protein n=1 Tax=Aureimonas flava TaxID=2320271 RepID=A0A3A1WPC6_9HYPH|nr:calcium-binding protein [Aureimonas flava]RIY02593.1 calcium-binding protein [Aureimonas flava]